MTAWEIIETPLGPLFVGASTAKMTVLPTELTP